MDEIRIVFNGKNIIFVKKGTNLLEAEREAGLKPDAPCGGQGKCGKCKVRIIRGSHASEELACQVTVTENMEVETLSQEAEHKILTRGVGRMAEAQPGIPVLPNREDAESTCALAAFDVGTTTIAAYLLDAYDGRTLAIGSMLNPQSEYAADVIGRCNYELEHEGRHLCKIVRKAMSELLGELAGKAGIKTEDIYGISFAGNTAMHHLFLGLSTKTLVVAPYVPAIVKEQVYKAEDYGFNIHPGGILRVLPIIGSFVGADTSACLLAAEFDKLDKLTLMIDIGTNGEIVLGNRERMMACSTAAGPAFEGAKITFGMRGAAGAIDHAAWENGQLKYTVIDNKEPVGICGSGLIDVISVMLNREIIEPSGYLRKSPYYLTDKIYISQKDIRELQLAKAAIAAGIRLLCLKMGVTLQDIETVLIAGAFGNYMSPASACAIGLIPTALQSKIIGVGNAAGEGAKLAIVSEKEFIRAAKIAEKAEFMELAFLPEFQDVFVEQMEFPEPDSEAREK